MKVAQTEESQEPTRSKSFFRKYFLEGQHLEESTVQEIPPDADFIERFLILNRKYIAFIFPIIVMQTLWWVTAVRYDWLSLYETRWQMPLIMILGALVAGMTSEGGGAVAFPFMTLGLHIDPITARDFSLLMQSVGMMCAMFAIIFMKVQIEQRAVLFGTIGSIPGLIIGFKHFDPLFDAAQKKMLFVSIWASFAIALFILNSQKKRKTYKKIPDFVPWKALVLIATGFVGGIFTAFAGSGVDICVFSITTLLFRITEKTATPTTVVLMGINSMVGGYYRLVLEGDVPSLALDYLKVSIPVGVTLAPFGSFLGSHFHRQVMACFIYVLEAVSVIGFLITRPELTLIFIGTGIIFAGFIFFSIISRAGQRLMERYENGLKEKPSMRTIETIASA
nr:Protein F26A1.8 [Haemonchus contortus]